MNKENSRKLLDITSSEFFTLHNSVTVDIDTVIECLCKIDKDLIFDDYSEYVKFTKINVNAFNNECENMKRFLSETKHVNYGVLCDFTQILTDIYECMRSAIYFVNGFLEYKFKNTNDESDINVFNLESKLAELKKSSTELFKHANYTILN